MRDALAAAIPSMAQPDASIELSPTKTHLADPDDLVQRVRSLPAWLLWGIPSGLVLLLIFLGTLLALSLWPQNEPEAIVQESTQTVTPTGPASAPELSPTSAPPTLAPTSPPTEPPATQEPTPLPAPTATPEPTAAIVPQLPPAPPNTIRIALQSPQSGVWAALGTGIRNAAELAVAQRNRPLDNLGYIVEFVPFDDQSSVPQGRANAEAIVADPAVLCVVGHFNSGVTTAAQPIYAAANLVQISPGSTNPSVTDATDNVWRVVGRDDVQGVIAAQFAHTELQSQRAYVLHDNTPYGRPIAQFFRQEAQNNGLEIVGYNFFDGSQAEIDFTPFLDEIQALDLAPDLIFAPLPYTQGGIFFRQARARGITAQFLGADSLDNPELVTLGGEAVSGMHFTTVAAPVSAFPQARQFVEDYRNTFGQEAPPFSPESYDAATLCIEVIATAGLTSGQYPTREQVLAAMRTFPRLEGISGNYRFNANGDPVSVGYYVVQVNTQNYSANRIVSTQLVGPPN
jgi:ABC-type branched-subunit amino acid transport system substrate-binding protein